jgi:hypothetical protein
VNGVVTHLYASEIAHHRTLYLMEVIGCRFDMAGCKIQLLRKDMAFEKDSGAHTSTLYALQIAQARIRELESNQNMPFIFRVHISQLDRMVYSTTLKISGLSFSLTVYPSQTHTGWHSLCLCLAEDTGRVNSLSVEADFETVSYSALPFTLQK